MSGTITTTQNYITLSPYNGTVLPSNVSVTPTLNGVQYPTKVSTITRSDIVETITGISGNSIVCSGNFFYSLTGNLQTGQNVSWSLSNNSLASLSNASNTGVTINVTGIGAVTLTATISNGCGQSYTVTKDLFSGAAAITTELEPFGSNYVAIYLIGSNGTDINAQGITNVTWEVLSTSGSCTPSFSASGFEGLGMGNCSNWVVNLKITVTNACGDTILYRTVTPPPPCDDNFRLANNPMKSGGKVNKIIIDPCDDSRIMMGSSTQNKTYTISISNIYGNEVYNESQKNTTFYFSNLEKGLYIVQLKSPNGKMSNKKLLVE
ncbi:T9SS type A sorting domain-containing protein [Yeosuana marina]|uniref:T9SS type A sorting domain-containing protein n=1 Tax=Yeosuana marina TaxID=1565536 RepID=UPI0030C82F96